MSNLFEPLPLARGSNMPNRFMLAPLTNQQSHADGSLSDEEHRWLTKRAEGGFGLVLTAASHVQPAGQGFAGQLGIFSDALLPGLTRLAESIKAQGALCGVQLYHAGRRAAAAGVKAPVAPSEDSDTGARALTLDEVQRLRDDFIAAALRAERAGFDGVELHGAHGYIISAFLSPELNRRTDDYGGSPANRSRLLFEVIDGVRAQTGPAFQIGVRLSPERFGLRLGEIRDVAAECMRQGKIDYIDLSLGDFAAQSADEAYAGTTVLEHFTSLPRGNVRLGAAGKVSSARTAAAVLAAGCDFVVVGRAAILRHDFPNRVRNDPDYESPALPVTVDHLVDEGVSGPFINYLKGWPGFIAD